jgi:hypothetical protein
MPNSLFEEEIKVFHKNYNKWIKMKMDGLVVIIKGNEVLGFAGTLEEAYKKALDRLGNVPFYLKRIEENKK